MKIGLFYDVESTNWGPGKVVSNLKRGLEELGVEYKSNLKCDFNIILQGGAAPQRSFDQKLEAKNTLVGPCVEVFLGDNKAVYNKYNYYVAASSWHKKLYQKRNSKLSKNKKVFEWPCGIDTEFYKPFEKADKYNDYILYDKNSLSNYHHWLREFADGLSQKMCYALGNTNYENAGLKAYCDASKYCISANASETQGFGIMEIMSMDLPIFVLDRNYHWCYGTIGSKIQATSCPYFSEQVGVLLHMKDYVFNFQKTFKKMKPPSNDIVDYTKCDKEFRVDFIKEKFQYFLDNLNSYSPRDYILENHTLKKGAQKLIDIFEKL